MEKNGKAYLRNGRHDVILEKCYSGKTFIIVIEMLEKHGFIFKNRIVVGSTIIKAITIFVMRKKHDPEAKSTKKPNQLAVQLAKTKKGILL